MANGLFDNVYNPDVLSCLANLSNDEVFTPPDVVNQMLDMLPQELFRNPDTTFLDPACKTGVFLREIAKRLIVGLEPQFPDLQERLDHIFHHQLYGIAITELTSLLSRRGVYCSKFPNSEFSVSRFDDAQGNIRFKRIKHTWQSGKCIFCGAAQSEYDRPDVLESYAYELLHPTKDGEEFFKMKFDVIIGNPPYQLSDGGFGKSAKPIYHLFIEQAKKLKPRYLSMIIPSRWFSGGRGLDEFRKTMLADKRIRELVDYENFKDIFPGVDLAGGACFFLWDRDNEGACKVTNCSNNSDPISEIRLLDEFDVFIRSNKALSIVRKVMSAHKGKYMDKTVSPSKPFGLRTFYEPKNQGIPCQFIQRIGLKYADPKDVEDSLGILDKWKFLAPRSPIAGQTDFTKPVGFYYDGNTRIVPPGTCCTESFVVLFSADTEEEVLAFKSYLYTKTVRFLLLQCVVSQDVTREKYRFVPYLGKYSGEYTDKMLCELWGITDDEFAFIDSKISDIGE
jgi:hypothetical protein